MQEKNCIAINRKEADKKRQIDLNNSKFVHVCNQWKEPKLKNKKNRKNILYHFVSLEYLFRGFLYCHTVKDDIIHTWRMKVPPEYL